MTDRTGHDASFVESAWQRHIGLALLLTGNRTQAAELLQDSLVRMYERWRKLSRLDDLDACRTAWRPATGVPTQKSARP